MCAIFGGVISGIGSGLAIRAGGAMDGIEVLAIIFAKRLGIIGSNVSSLAKANINYVTNSYTSSGAASNSSDDLYSLMTSKFNSRG